MLQKFITSLIRRFTATKFAFLVVALLVVTFFVVAYEDHEKFNQIDHSL